MLKFYPAVLSLSLIMVCPQTGFSATDSTPMMDEVVVSASRVEEKKKEVSANITTISREDIENSASSNLGELLAEKGFGHIQKYPGNLTSIGIRGFRTDTHGNDLQGQVLVLLDGRRAATGNVAKILNKNIEKIEIIRGPGAVQYGSAGMGGIVNVITRTGEENSMFLETTVGSYGHKEGSAGVTAKVDDFDFAGSISTLTSDDYDTGDGVTFYNTGTQRETGVSFNTGYTFNKNHRIGLIFTHYEVEEAGSPGYLSANDLDDYNDKSNTSLDAQYTGSSQDKKYSWMARYFTGEDDSIWNDPTESNPTGWDNDMPSTNLTEQQGAQIQATGVFGLVTLTTGFDWVEYEVTNSWAPQETYYSNPALFLLGKAKFMDDKLTGTFGLRQDWFDVEVNKPKGRDEEQDNLTPQIGLAFQATENIKVRAQYAQGFMMPSAKQLANDSVRWGRRVVGNPNLDPEKSETYEAGVDVQVKSFKGSLTYFHTDFENKIVTDYLADGSQSWKNLGEATVSGIEAELSYDIGEALDLEWEIRPYLNLTHLTDFTDEQTGDDLRYVSETSLSAGVTTNCACGLTTRINVAYYSSQMIEDWETGGYPTPIVEHDDITVADLTASYPVYETEKLGKFTLKGEIKNLTDEDYAFVNGYPMPGRTFFLTLRWDY